MHRGLCYVESKFKKHLFFCLFTFLAELSQVLPTRPERAPLAQGIALGNYGRKTVAL